MNDRQDERMGPSCILHWITFVWITATIWGTVSARKNQQIYADGVDCGNVKDLGAAVVYSHHFYSRNVNYPVDVECTIKFRAEHDNWRLRLEMKDVDIPYTPLYEHQHICEDALYIYDGDSYTSRAFKLEDGPTTGAVCGTRIPPVLRSSGQFITMVFRSGSTIRQKGRGFKFVITAFSNDAEKYGSCGSRFQCGVSGACVDEDLVCDGVDHCGDGTDEADCRTSKHGEGGSGGGNFLSRFMSLGVAAILGITLGTLLVPATCITIIVCCCCRMRRKSSGTKAEAGRGGAAAGPLIAQAAPPHPPALHNTGASFSAPSSAAAAQPHKDASSGASGAPSSGPSYAARQGGYYPLHPLQQQQQQQPPGQNGGVTYANPYPPQPPDQPDYSAPPPHYAHAHSGGGSHPRSSHTPPSSRSAKSRGSGNSVSYRSGEDRCNMGPVCV